MSGFSRNTSVGFLVLETNLVFSCLRFGVGIV